MLTFNHRERRWIRRRETLDLRERDDRFDRERDYRSGQREKKDHDGREEGNDRLKIRLG